MIDFTQIGITVEREHRPYLWLGEDADSHVKDFEQRRKNERLLDLYTHSPDLFDLYTAIERSVF